MVRTIRRVLLGSVLALAALALLAPAASAAGYLYDSAYGGPGTAIGQFGSPGAIAFANGELFIGDNTNGRVQVFDADGAFVRAWSGVAFPTGVGVDRRRGLVYVAEFSLSQVRVFDRAGNVVRTLATSGAGDAQVSQPYQIAVDSAGNVYVADSANNRINVFDATGAPLRRWGSLGTDPGQFNRPTGVAIDAADNVYTFETTGRRVQKFDTIGTPLAQWGSAGSGDDQFGFNDYFLAVAPDGNVLVADAGNDAVKEFTPDGTFVRAVTHGELDGPLGIAVTPDRTLFTASITSHTIVRHDWDDTAPVITHDYDGEWHSEPVTVTFSAVDDFTPVPWLRWSSDNGATWTDSGSMTVSADPATHAWDGFNSRTIGAGDSVSNWAYKVLRVKIDTRAPVSTVSGVPAGWTNQDVTAHIAATDAGSGVDDSYYDLDGGGLTEVPATGIVTIDTEGEHTLQYWSEDNCVDMPNQEAPKTVAVWIDKMGPDAFPRYAVSVRRGSYATFKYGLNDQYSPTCTVKLVIKKKTKTVKTINLGVKDSAFQVPQHNYSKRIRISLPAGTYTWTVQAKDLAGNIGSYAPKKLTVKP